MNKFLFDFRNPLRMNVRVSLPGIRIDFHEMQFGDIDFIIPDHTHSYFETSYIADGSGLFSYIQDSGFEKKRVTIQYGPGTLIQTGPGLVHNIKPVTKSRVIYWTWEAVSGPLCRAIKPIECSSDAKQAVYPFIQAIINECIRPWKDSARAVRSLITHLLRAECGLFHCAEVRVPLVGRIPHSGLAHKALTFIRDNFFQDLSLADLARQFRVGTRQMIRILKSHEPPIRFCEELRRARVQAACQLFIRNRSLKVKEAARQCGFGDEYYFSRTFKRMTGVSPEQFRRAPVKKETS